MTTRAERKIPKSGINFVHITIVKVKRIVNNEKNHASNRDLISEKKEGHVLQPSSPQIDAP